MADVPKRSGAALRAVGPQVSPALEKVRSGELSVEAYVEERVEQALALMNRHMKPDELDQVRHVLREHVMTDPGLRKQLTELTGKPLPES